MISVIIPTCDEAVALRATLDSGANISHRERCSRCSRKVSLANNPPWHWSLRVRLDYSASRALFCSANAFLPLHGRAVWPSPVIALFAEGHKQGIPNGVVFWQRVAGNADDNFVLRNVYS